MVKGSSEKLSKANQTVSIGLERLQCRLQDPKMAKHLNPKNTTKNLSIIDTTKPTSWDCFGDPNNPTCGKKFTQTKPFIF